jgi:hypothetical protein
MSAEINAVNVYSIDEEKLKFRVIVAIDADQLGAATGQQGLGQYQVDIPVPTAIANSDKYNSCLMKCDSFVAGPLTGVAAPSWIGLAGGAALKGFAIELQVSTPSSQTAVSHLSGLGNGTPEVGGYRQILAGQNVNVGSGAAGGGWGPVATGYAWLGMMRDISPLLCANPFGQTITIRLVDPIVRDRMYIGGLGGGPGAGTDVGQYIMQFEITMVEN